jgi:hypothetical protein
VLFKTSLNAAVKKMLLQYYTGTTFPPLYCKTLMYKVVNETPAVDTLSGMGLEQIAYLPSPVLHYGHQWIFYL